MSQLITHHFTLITFHNGPIRLVHLALGKHLVESGKGLRRAGKDHQPRYRTVQAMDDAEEHLAGLLVLLLDVFLDGLAERLVTRLVALHNFAAVLADDDDMVVLVDNFHAVSLLIFVYRTG